MPTFNLDNVEFEKIYVTIKGVDYELLPMTSEMNRKLIPLEKELSKKRGTFETVIERLMVLTAIPRKVLESLTLQQMQEINDYYIESAFQNKKKEPEEPK